MILLISQRRLQISRMICQYSRFRAMVQEIGPMREYSNDPEGLPLSKDDTNAPWEGLPRRVVSFYLSKFLQREHALPQAAPWAAAFSRARQSIASAPSTPVTEWTARARLMAKKPGPVPAFRISGTPSAGAMERLFPRRTRRFRLIISRRFCREQLSERTFQRSRMPSQRGRCSAACLRSASSFLTVCHLRAAGRRSAGPFSP